MNISQRLDLFFQRLKDAPPAASAEEAMRLVGRLIEEVEDEFCPLPREEPPPVGFTGRMYAPREDRMRRILPQGTLVADTRHHKVFCQPTGEITIQRKSRFALQPVFSKEGRKP